VGVTPGTGESGHWWDRFIHKSSFRSGFRPESNGGLFNDLEEKKNLPPGILDAVWKTESGRGQNMVSKAGALGHFQFMPATAQRYGVQDPFDLGQSAKGAASYFSDLLARFHGDIEKAAAGYNWGEGNVEKDVARYGARWKEHLPEETAGYVRKVTEGIGQACKGASIVTIRVENNTGGNASVSASELAT
jgi:soluble lytic murein transglycosylase-like protein